ncbi:MAG: nucleotidyltransferase family protein [Myxococcales bacterium]
MLRGAHEPALKLLAAELVRRVVRTLTPLAIPVMPLKGVLWQATLYGPHESRPLADVDLLVPAEAFDAAAAALLAAGFVYPPGSADSHEDFASWEGALPLPELWRQLVTGYTRERELSSAELPLLVDLHRSVFARGRYSLSTRALFERAHHDTALFGVPVWVPHPLDQLAHLLGHLATDHRPGNAMYRADFERLLTHERLLPLAAAEHLERHGLARAARFALRELDSPNTQGWVEACVREMRPDRLGDLLAESARTLVNRVGRFSPWSALVGHGLNSDPRQIAKALSWAAIARLRARLL